MYEALWTHAWLTKILTHLLTYGSCILLLSWITALIGAVLTFIIRTDHGYRKTFRNFLRFCFPSEILRNPSCRVDALYTIAARLLFPLIVVPLLITSAAVTQMTHDGLTAWFGSHPPDSNSVTVRVLALLGVVVLADGSNFLTHYLNHKVKILWEFHKIHHSAAFLIPITNRRTHPVQVVFDDTFLLLTVGIWLGLISYAVRMPIADNVVLGMDAYYFANLLSFYHLRHSHIPMSYGWLENIFLSPAQHHLHHSYVVRHWDRNFGLLLSCWDKMAGTFMLSEAPETVHLGLPAQYVRCYDTVSKLYVTPIVNVIRMITSRAEGSADRASPAQPIKAGNIALNQEIGDSQDKAGVIS